MPGVVSIWVIHGAMRRSGGHWLFQIKCGHIAFTTLLHFAKTNDLISTSIASIDPALGFQLDYDEFVFLRAGIGNFQNITEFDGIKNLTLQPNFGVGFLYNGIQIDYALTNIGSLGNALFSNIFSVKIDYSFFRR